MPGNHIEAGTGSQRLVVDKQRLLLQEFPRVIFVEAAKGLLFRLANQDNGVTCVKKLEGLNGVNRLATKGEKYY